MHLMLSYSIFGLWDYISLMQAKSGAKNVNLFLQLFLFSLSLIKPFEPKQGYYLIELVLKAQLKIIGFEILISHDSFDSNVIKLLQQRTYFSCNLQMYFVECVLDLIPDMLAAQFFFQTIIKKLPRCTRHNCYKKYFFFEQKKII